MKPQTIHKKEILRLCQLLGEDPEMVSQITIHPSYVIVEHLHAIHSEAGALYESGVTEHEVTS